MKKVDFGGLFHKKFVSKNSFAYQVMAELDGIPTELGGVMSQLRWIMILFYGQCICQKNSPPEYLIKTCMIYYHHNVMLNQQSHSF